VRDMTFILQKLEEITSHFHGIIGIKAEIKDVFKKRVFRPLEEEVSEFLTSTAVDLLSEELEYLLTKYGEEGFKQRAREDFNILRDCQVNHAEDYRRWMPKVQRLNRFIRWDSGEAVNTIASMLEKRGFNITSDERDYLFRQCELFKEEISGI